jgi:hypothetical protein
MRDLNHDGVIDLLDVQQLAALFTERCAIPIITDTTIVVNDVVTFDPLEATFKTTTGPTGCPAGFAGSFSFKSRLTNIGAQALADLELEVTTLTGGGRPARLAASVRSSLASLSLPEPLLGDPTQQATQIRSRRSIR